MNEGKERLNLQLQLMAYVFHHNKMRKDNTPLWCESLSLLVASLERSIEDFDTAWFLQIAIAGRSADGPNFSQNPKKHVEVIRRTARKAISTMIELKNSKQKRQQSDIAW